METLLSSPKYFSFRSSEEALRLEVLRGDLLPRSWLPRVCYAIWHCQYSLGPSPYSRATPWTWDTRSWAHHGVGHRKVSPCPRRPATSTSDCFLAKVVCEEDKPLRLHGSCTGGTGAHLLASMSPSPGTWTFTTPLGPKRKVLSRPCCVHTPFPSTSALVFVLHMVF